MIALFAAAAAAAVLAVTWEAALTPWFGSGGWPAVALAGLMALAAWLAPSLGKSRASAVAVGAGLLGGALGWAAAAGLLAPVAEATGGSPLMNSVTLMVPPAVLTSVALGELGRRVSLVPAVGAAGAGGLLGALGALVVLHPAVGLSPTAIGAAVGFAAAAIAGLRSAAGHPAGPGLTAAVITCLLGAALPGLTNPNPLDTTSWRALRDAGGAAHLGVFLHGAPARGLLIAELTRASDAEAAAALESHLDLRLEVISPSQARAHLLADGEPYDLIVAPGPDAWAGGATVQFYLLVADRLAPGGLFVQTLPLHRLTDRDGRRRIAALNAALEGGLLFRDPGGAPVAVYGSTPSVDLDDWALRGADPAVSAALSRLDLDTPYRLLSGYSLGREALEAAADGVWLARDNRPQAKLAAPHALADDLVGDPFDLVEILTRQDAAQPELLDERSGLRASTEAVLAARAAEALAGMSPPAWKALIFGSAMRPALYARPGDPGLLHLLGLGPDAPDDDWTDARRAYYEGRYTEALAGLEALEGSGDEALRQVLIGGCKRALGDTAGASAAFAAAALGGHEKMAALLTVMAARADAPWPEAGGPLAGPE